MVAATLDFCRRLEAAVRFDGVLLRSVRFFRCFGSGVSRVSSVSCLDDNGDDDAGTDDFNMVDVVVVVVVVAVLYLLA